MEYVLCVGAYYADPATVEKKKRNHLSWIFPEQVTVGLLFNFKLR